MGLDVPELDDRAYADILEDARKLLSVYTEEWTDHNVHDPGITFLELFSWLAETYTYQLDHITERHVRKYIGLVGDGPRPPESAVAHLKLDVSDDPQVEGIPEGEEIPEGEQLIIDDGEGFVGVFETTKPVTLTRTRVARVVSIHDGAVDDNSTANDTYGLSFLAFGERAERGSAMYIGFDRDPFDAANIIDLTVDYKDDDLPQTEAHEPEDPEFEPSVELDWEFFRPVGGEDASDQQETGDAWREATNWRTFIVPRRRDRTDRLYHGGTVALEINEEEWTGEKTELFDLDDAFVWIRCRVRKSGYEVPPELNSLHLDVVPARHRASHQRADLRRVEDGAAGEREGMETTARPGQTFAFEQAPVLEAKVAVGGRRWNDVRDFDASAPDDEHYVLDHTAGSVRFGDGVRGKVPEAGQRVVAETYTHGGGKAGNVPRSATCTFVRDRLAKGVNVSLVDDAEGGADAESTEDALARVQGDLTKPYRTVSLEDYRYVAVTTPGLRFGRATAQVRPRTPTEDDGDGVARNEVRVVVVPYSTLPYPPRPSEGFIRAVERHLERHRLLTDQVVVEAPTYVGIGVDAEVNLEPGYTPAGRRGAIAKALDEFLDPLGSDAPDDEGWPFGRAVYVSELYEVIKGVPGVEGVIDVAIRAWGEEDIDGDGNVLLGPMALPDPGEHHVNVRTNGGA